MIAQKFPENWKQQRLAELVEKFDSGVSVNGGDRAAVNGEFGVLKVSAVTEGKFRPNENKIINGREHERAYLNPKRNCLIMSRANTPDLVGASAFIDSDYPSLYLSDKLWQLEPRENKQLSMRWLGFVLGSSTYRRIMSNIATGSSQSMKNISQQSVMQLEIPVPPFEEQCHIAKLLATWDTAIEKTEKLIEKKQQQHAWFLWSLIESKVARSHWQFQGLGQIISERNERSNRHDEYPVLTSSRRGLFLQSEYFSKQVTSENNSGYKIMHKGDFTFRSMSDNGKFTFNRLDQLSFGIISPAYGVFYAIDANSDFLRHYMNSTYFAMLLARETQGGTRKALRLSMLMAMRICLPSRQEQIHIACILNNSRSEIALLQNQVEKLRLQKRGLMQKLLTGEWRVPVPEMEVA